MGVLTHVLWLWYFYIEEISIKSDTKKMKDYQMPKIIIALYLSFRPIFWPLSHNSYKRVSTSDNNGFRLSLKESVLTSRDSPVLNKNTASTTLLLFD